MLTIVMYHYVREHVSAEFPGIHALPVAMFDRQLDYLLNHYNMVGLEDIIDAIHGVRALPPEACHLTFDDGLIDHYVAVFPRLLARQVRASFYPSAASANRRVLDVHKVHHILAVAGDVGLLRREIDGRLFDLRMQHDLPACDELYDEFGKPSRYDPAEVVYIKRLLQTALPLPVRRQLTSELFERYVTSDERSFAEELYMSPDHCREMVSAGMSIGGHGYEHVWLGRLSIQEQESEIAKSHEFVETVYGRPVEWAMSYPYGSFNDDTISILRRHGCIVAFTTHLGGNESCDDCMAFNRINANDVPV